MVVRLVFHVHVVFIVLVVALQFHSPFPEFPFKPHERRHIERVYVREILPLSCVYEVEVRVLHLFVPPCRASVHSRRQVRPHVRLLSPEQVEFVFYVSRYGVRPVVVVIQLAAVVLGVCVCRRVGILQLRRYLVACA